MCVDQTYVRACSLRDEWNRNFPFFPNERESGTLFVDANSAARNSTSAAAACRTLPAAAATFVAASSAVGGVIGVPVGLSIVRDGLKSAKAAADVSDWEGTACKTAWAGIGAGYAGLSSLLATSGIMTLANRTVPTSIGTAFGGLGVGFYGMLLGYGAYGLWQTSKFRRELKRALEEGRAEEWIKEQVTLNETEQKLPEEEQKTLLQKKWNQFELRTSSSCGKLVRDSILEGRAIDVLEVEKASYKETIKHIFFIVLALLGIAASLCVLFLTGPVSPILFAVSAVLWVGVDSSGIYDYLGEKFWMLLSPANNPSEQKKKHSAA
ncbi:MAG: hypothetical protein K1X28_01135 [Parachlamydiales bacterium]|nr:hypothetical protein [Parachlamydiales bacterium]